MRRLLEHVVGNLTSRPRSVAKLHAGILLLCHFSHQVQRYPQAGDISVNIRPNIQQNIIWLA